MSNYKFPFLIDSYQLLSYANVLTFRISLKIKFFFFLNLHVFAGDMLEMILSSEKGRLSERITQFLVGQVSCGCILFLIYRVQLHTQKTISVEVVPRRSSILGLALRKRRGHTLKCFLQIAQLHHVLVSDSDRPSVPTQPQHCTLRLETRKHIADIQFRLSSGLPPCFVKPILESKFMGSFVRAIQLRQHLVN